MAEERMVDAIFDGSIVTIPESKAREDELFVLRVHEKHEVSVPAFEQPSRKTRDPVLQPKSNVKWHSYQPDYKKNNVTKDLKDNFHWEIGKARKSKNMTRLQLANALSVPETAIRMIENGELPSDDFVLVNKVQSYFGINLRRDGASFSSPAISGDLGPAYVPKVDYSKDVSLADLQRLKSQREKYGIQKSDKNILSGSDIEIID